MGGTAMKGRPLPLSEASELGQTAALILATRGAITKVEIAGAVRRKKSICSDVDIVVVPTDQFHECFTEMFREHRYAGPIRYTGVRNGAQIDFLLTDDESFGAALMHFTGSVQTNIKMRARAKVMGFLLNEKGLWRGSERIAGKTEEEIYRCLQIDWVAPELR